MAMPHADTTTSSVARPRSLGLTTSDPLNLPPWAILLVIASATAVCGFVGHPRAFLLMVGVLVVAVVGCIWPAITVAGVRVSARYDRPRVSEGESSVLYVSVRNRLPWASWGLTLTGVGGLGGKDDEIALDSARGWHTTKLRVEIQADRRGVYPDRPVEVTCAFPFGVWTSRRKVDVENQLIVWPARYAVPGPPESARREDAAGVAITNRSGGAGDFLGTRPYRQGEPIRRIHWAASARHNQLIVCERERRAVVVARVILDTRAHLYDGIGPDDGFEWAIRIAASLCERWLGEGADVELRCGDHRVRDRDPMVLSRMLDVLAQIKADDAGAPPRVDHPDSVLITSASAQQQLGIRPNGRLIVVGRSAAPCWIAVEDLGDVPDTLRRASRG